MAKAVFCDIDGTLIAGDKIIREESANAIRALLRQRIPFVAVTGRACHGAKPLFDEVGLKIPIIGCSGAICQKAEGDILWQEGFSLSEAKEVLRFVRRGFPSVVPCIYTKEAWYVEDNTHPYVKREEVSVRFPAAKIAFSDLVDGLIINKVLLMHETAEQAALLEALCAQFPYLKFVPSADCLIEVLPLHIDKGFAVQKYCELYNIDPKDCIAFGDHGNDVDMLRAVGNSYAVENASPEVKAAAKQLCPSCGECGVAKTLCTLFSL